MVIEIEAALQMPFFRDGASHCSCLSQFWERRCEQVPVMNIVICALYGLVMNPIPP